MAGHKVTHAPTGLTLSRSGNYFICSWALGEKGIDAQEMQVLPNGYPVAWGIGKADTSTTVYYLGWGVVTAFAFLVRNKDTANKTDWSAWSPSPWFYILPAHAPTVSHTLNSATRSTFHVSVEHSDTDNNPTSGYVWQSVLAKDGIADWSKAQGATVYGYSADTAFEESGFGSGDYCYVRWFRACGIGYAGNSGWVYDKHVYAPPNRARNTSATYKELAGGGAQISVTWQSDVSEYRPIDKVSVKYLAHAPIVSIKESGNTMTMSLSAPNTDSGWTTLQEPGGNGGGRSASVTVPTKLNADECAFVRIDNKHDEVFTYGAPVMANGGTGRLATPSFSGEITPGGEGMENLYTINVNRGTSIDNAAIAIHFRTDKQQSRNDVIGIIPPKGSSRYRGDTIQVWIPSLPVGENPSFGVRAFVGDYTPLAPTSSTSPTYYTVKNIKMQSDTNWTGGVVPLPPQLTISQISSDTVQAAWTWSWTDANSAELSWANHEDAWYSTDEPSKYIVSNGNVSRWNIRRTR